MGTTAVFVEILIIGVQAAIWVILLIAGLFGYEWISTIKLNLDNWATLITVVAFALCYTLGIIVDRVADGFFLLGHPKKLLLKNKFISKKAEEGHSDVRMAILAKEGNTSTFLEYIRSRIRIVRATALNLILVIASMLIFILARCDLLGCASKLNLVLATLGIGGGFFIVTLFVLGMLEVTYDARLLQAERELASTTKRNGA